MSEPDDGLERAGELPSRFDIFDPTQGIEDEAKALTEGDLFSKLFFQHLVLYAIREELATQTLPKSWISQKNCKTSKKKTEFLCTPISAKVR